MRRIPIGGMRQGHACLRGCWPLLSPERRNGILGDVSKHIYIFSPSSAVRDKAAFRRGLTRLKALGYDVEVDAAALASHQRFAGDDDTRLAAIERAAASGADVALISRGGYGLTRILDGIPYKKVAKAIGNGTQFVGLSDFTAFQIALLAKTGAISWAGPALGDPPHRRRSSGPPAPLGRSGGERTAGAHPRPDLWPRFPRHTGYEAVTSLGVSRPTATD